MSMTDDEQMTVTVIGKPDFAAIPEAKLDSFVDFCMKSLNRYYHSDRKEAAEANGKAVQTT